MFNFEKLEVWQKSIALADVIYHETPELSRGRMIWLNKSDATIGRFGVFQYCGRIVEKFKDDFRRFVEIGTGSVFELVSQSFIAQRQDFLSEGEFPSHLQQRG